jgi:hypothetical protein
MLILPVMGNTAAAGGAAAAAAIAQAIKASGAIVRVEPDDFRSLLRRHEAPLVVHALGGFLVRKHRYLSSYKGLAFYTQSAEPVELPVRCELVEARSFWMPG